MKSTDAYYFEFDPKILCLVVKKRPEELHTLANEQPNETKSKKKKTKK